MQQKFTTEIYAEKPLKGVSVKKIYESRDLIKMFVKKNFIALYKQTILGPAWIVINPLMTSIIFTFIFGELAGITTDGAPQILFYMSGNILWTLFSSSTNDISKTFITNLHIFSKVYFERLTVPIATAITAIINFLFQLGFYFLFFIYYVVTGDAVAISPLILLLPVIILQIAMLSMGIGIIINSITTKYRDLIYVFPIMVQLMMYVTPIVYPSSSLSGITKLVVLLNPVSTPVEILRAALLSVGNVHWEYWGISLVVTIVIFFIGVVLFRKSERSFVDVL